MKHTLFIISWDLTDSKNEQIYQWLDRHDTIELSAKSAIVRNYPYEVDLLLELKDDLESSIQNLLRVNIVTNPNATRGFDINCLIGNNNKSKRWEGYSNEPEIKFPEFISLDTNNEAYRRVAIYNESAKYKKPSGFGDTIIEAELIGDRIKYKLTVSFSKNPIDLTNRINPISKEIYELAYPTLYSK